MYHIQGNKYTYSDAPAICKAFGGRLANYKEIENAYNKGANWCSYGWSADQLALFPTQYEKWQKLQGIEGHKNDCGRPGINGGYIDNPNVRFGVNCYGKKRDISSYEDEMMNMSTSQPQTEEEKKFDEKVRYWKGKLPEIIVSPFNSENWSKI